jgi:hypothetical protein
MGQIKTYDEQTTVGSTDKILMQSGSTDETKHIEAATLVPSIGAQTTFQTASETTSSTSYTNLATSGPAATAEISTSGRAIVFIAVTAGTSTASGEGWRVGFAISGATTVAASDEYSIGVIHQDVMNNQVRLSGAFLVTGLSIGNNTFTMQYKVSGSTTGTYDDRKISVIPI